MPDYHCSPKYLLDPNGRIAPPPPAQDRHRVREGGNGDADFHESRRARFLRVTRGNGISLYRTRAWIDHFRSDICPVDLSGAGRSGLETESRTNEVISTGSGDDASCILPVRQMYALSVVRHAFVVGWSIIMLYHHKRSLMDM